MSSSKTAESSSGSSKIKAPRSVSDISTASSASSSSAALLLLLAPDGYYTYLGITKPADPKDPVDEELVKKNYRRLSLKHHPDRRSGDNETFRVLKRAQVVLLNQKLREQYDILGLDLDDEEEHHDDEEKKEGSEENENVPPPVPETIVSHMATSALAFIMQLGVRTAMMGAVSVFLCRWRITVFPALAFLLFIAYKIVSTVRRAPTSGASYMDLLSPLTIGTGLVFLHRGRDLPDVTWSYVFWIGEAMVMTMFTVNSLPPNNRTPPLILSLSVAALLLTLWLSGQFWRYMTIVGMIAFVAMVTAMAFPLMELVLEEIIKEKLKKVGEKVRAHNKRMEEYYAGSPAIFCSVRDTDRTAISH